MSSTGPGTPRRLDRPPSDRFRTAEATTDPGVGPDGAAAGSLVRAALAADATALAGAVLTVLLGGVLALSAGLLVVWLSMGGLVGQVTRWAGGAAVAPAARIALAVGSALVGVAVGQVGLWLYAQAEGGALSLVDYLAQTFGVLVPLQAILAAVAAWWNAR